MMKLLIVESPAKVKKIASFLGEGWIVEASRGHVRDLPDDALGISVEAEFAPQYRLLPDKSSVVARLKKAIKTAEAVYLATDPDREGEAIAWHILELARAEAKNKPIHRVSFTAITKTAVLAALNAPRRLDNHLIEAQQTRRIVDRLVGYLVSPLACKALDSRVSAGRVQSVCLRLIVEREREIAAFTPTRHWALDATLKAPSGAFNAHLAAVRGKQAEFAEREQLDKLMHGMTGALFWVSDVKQGEKTRRPLPPFITSSLQQAASKALGLSPEQTMNLAQALYEAGLITYMRTDSVAVAPEAQEAARQYVAEHYGQQYVPALPQIYESKAETAQEAHEAIRPTDVLQRPDTLKPGDGADLYSLIWKRFIASQMADARYQLTLARIAVGMKQEQPYPVDFYAKGRTLTFDGFLKVYQEALDEGEESESNVPLPALTPGLRLSFVDWRPTEHITKAPPRYTEAALVQTLEQRGIGRPSTYASMVKTVKEKGYVRLDHKRLSPTETGVKLCDFLVARFPVVFDIEYTAALERALDKVASGQTTRLTLLQTFWNAEFAEPYRGLANELAAKMQSKAVRIVGVCPKCGGDLVQRQGTHGMFAGCVNFPKCKGTAQPVRFTAVKEGVR